MAPRRKQPSARGVFGNLLNRAIDALPVELHLPGYQFCGPGTRLQKRLARGDQGINPLDNACRAHDIAYHEHKATEERQKADRVLADRAFARVHASDATLGERAAALGVGAVMKLKNKMGGQLGSTKLLRADARIQEGIRNRVRKKVTSRGRSSSSAPSKSLHPVHRLRLEIERTRRAIREKVLALRRGEAEREHLLDVYVKEPLKHVLTKSLPHHPPHASSASHASFDTSRGTHLVDSLLDEEAHVGTSTPHRAVAPRATSPPFSPVSLTAGPEDVYGDDDTPGDATLYLHRRPAATRDIYHIYLSRMVANETDTVFGPRFVRTPGEAFPTLVLGRTPVHLEENTLTVANRTHPVTEGLLELLFERAPNGTLITSADQRSYKQIMDATNAHRVGGQPNGRFKGRNTGKYLHFIRPMYRLVSRSGDGLRFGSRPTYAYWRDPNALVRRLRLLHASRAAGHDDHEGEIVQIEQELRAARILR